MGSGVEAASALGLELPQAGNGWKEMGGPPSSGISHWFVNPIGYVYLYIPLITIYDGISHC